MEWNEIADKHVIGSVNPARSQDLSRYHRLDRRGALMIHSESAYRIGVVKIHDVNPGLIFLLIPMARER
jgi:hypothetical protein